MRERNPLHIALGILGLLGALLYVLSCQPAWSPDSSKVLFPYSNPETKEQGVAIYDRNTGAVRSIYSCQPGRDKCSDTLPSAGWSGDGSQAVILWAETRKKKWKNPATRKVESVETTFAHVEVFPLGETGKKLHVRLRHFEPSDNNFAFPLVVLQGNLYLSGEGKRSLVQLNLKSGKQKYRTSQGDSEPALYSHDGHITYGRDSAENSDDAEFGELDTKDLSLHSWFTLKEKSLEAQGVSDFTGFIAFEPHGNRMVMPAVGKDQRPRILMCNRHGLERVLKPEFPNSASQLGNLAWSRDGKTLYAAVSAPTEKEGIAQYSLAEIPLTGGQVRLDPVLYVNSSPDKSFQISISPDGSTIAASTANYDKKYIDPANRGLFLVDLRDPARKVTRIQYPPVASENQTARE